MKSATILGTRALPEISWLVKTTSNSLQPAEKPLGGRGVEYISYSAAFIAMSGSSPDIDPLDAIPGSISPGEALRSRAPQQADEIANSGYGASEGVPTGAVPMEGAPFDAAKLIRDHQSGVWRYLRALGAEPPLAEDLTQETFLAVLRKPFEQYHPAATSAYLRKVAHNLFVTHCRRQQSTTTLTDLDRIEIDWSRWTRQDNGEDLILALRECLQSISPRAQTALQMRFRDRASRNEIAEALKLSPDGAKNLMQRAKKALRDCIEHRMQ